jgi:DNA polymerase III epsilon subunit family exonuclease
VALLDGLRFAVLDIETTGWNPLEREAILEVALVPVMDRRIGEGWSSLIGPARPVPPDSVLVHGITEAMLSGGADARAVARRLRVDCAAAPLVFHNAGFDLPFVAALLRAAGEPPLTAPVVDTLGLARGLFGSGGNSLAELAVRLELPAESFHRALGDARTTARVFLALAPAWEAERGVRSLDELAAESQDVVRESRRRAAALRAAAASELVDTSAGPPIISGLQTPLLDLPSDGGLTMAATATIDVGQQAPDFELKGPQGQPVTLSEYRDRKNVVLVFFPLAFSPVCSHQLPAIQRSVAEFERLDAVVFGVSVDSHHANTAFAKQLGIGFPLLSDFDKRTIAAYGVLDSRRGTSGRAVFVIDKQGTVVYRDVSSAPQDPAQIPSSERALEALRALR